MFDALGRDTDIVDIFENIYVEKSSENGDEEEIGGEENEEGDFGGPRGFDREDDRFESEPTLDEESDVEPPDLPEI